jgi:hypothetical protein
MYKPKVQPREAQRLSNLNYAGPDLWSQLGTPYASACRRGSNPIRTVIHITMAGP